jgi:signal transduction histidine kinase
MSRYSCGLRLTNARYAFTSAAKGSSAALVATVVTLFVPYDGSAFVGLLGLVEAAGLLALLALVVRTAPVRVAWWLGVLLIVTDLAYLLRVPPPPTLAAGMATLMVWFAGPVTALIAGGYPRLAEARRRRSVDEARRTQRRQLARDLHDFVAHDLTGIVVQAQAAQRVGQADPAIALTALRADRAGPDRDDRDQRAAEEYGRRAAVPRRPGAG